jgi:hypothetical protein
MIIHFDYFKKNLANNAKSFESLLSGLTSDQTNWKPSPEKWSLLEVVNHLYDEEREDFRQRLEIVLTDPSKPFPKIDPQAWVIEREYGKRNFDLSLQNFLEERENSINWLQELKNPDWTAFQMHPTLGEMSAAKLISNWLAHDYLHIRQICALKYGFLKSLNPGISLDYAGNW